MTRRGSPRIMHSQRCQREGRQEEKALSGDIGGRDARICGPAKSALCDQSSGKRELTIGDKPGNRLCAGGGGNCASSLSSGNRTVKISVNNGNWISAPGIGSGLYTSFLLSAVY